MCDVSENEGCPVQVNLVPWYMKGKGDDVVCFRHCVFQTLCVDVFQS